MGKLRSVSAIAAIAALSVAATTPLPAQPPRDGPSRGAGRGCVYFADADYRGAQGSIADGGERGTLGDERDNTLSSVRCDPGCILEIYDTILFGSERILLRGHVRFVGPAWNDRATSLRVRCFGSELVRGSGIQHDWLGGEVTGRFYRQRGLRQIVRQTWQSGYCTVQTPIQMEEFGGDALVRNVPLLVPRGQDDGACPWPGGLYRRDGERAIYALRGRFETRRGAIACRLVDPTQIAQFATLGRVRVVEADADLMRGRSFTGPCTAFDR